MAAPIATRQGLSASAHDRLRRHVLYGVAIVGMLTGAAGAVISLGDVAIDPRVVALFAPDIVIGLVIVWQLLGRTPIDTAVRTYAGYLVLNYAFFTFHGDGYEVFTTPWVILPPVFGFYLGGRRLGVVMTAILVAEGLISVVVHATGIGHRLLELPPANDAGSQVMIALGIAEILCLVYVFERRRERMRVELDAALGDLDNQTQTIVALVESTSDVIVLVDDAHRVVLHNRVASDMLRGIATGVSAPDLFAAETHSAWSGLLGACRRDGHARAEQTIAGRVFELSLSRVTVADRIIGFTLIARDITARRDAEAALRKMRGQLLDASRRSGIAETAAALLHSVGNALNSAMVASAMVGDQAAGLRVENFHRAVDEIEHGGLERGDERAAKLRAYLRGIANHLTERKTTLIAEARSLRASLDEVAGALSAQQQLAETTQVLDDVSLDEIVASALTADDCQISRNLAPTGTIVTDRQRVMQIVANLMQVCRGDGMHVALRPLDDGVALEVSPAQRTAFGDGIFAHGKPLHAAALAASALGGSLRCERAVERESFVLELPRIAPRIAVAS
ncbi:MAG TPA: PAS domain S-box protein [Kofleriaceae bacterium]|nr:PAS domain S-box protein [Kofleriaceae bacterium]